MIRSCSLPSPVSFFHRLLRPAALTVLVGAVLFSSACLRSSRSPHRNWEKIERETWIYEDAIQQGIVSWYGEPQLTAMGTVFDPEQMTAAHKTLPFGTRVRVTRLDTWHSVIVTINDRGPYIEGRIIDVARKPARLLDLIHKGIAPCRVEVIHRPAS